MITVIGSGTERGELTLNALRALREADEVVLRTGGIPAAQSLEDEHIPFTTFDYLYEKSRSYDTLTKKLVSELRRRGREKSVCYVVDGSGTEDAAACILLKSPRVRLLDGGSKTSTKK